MRLRSHLSGARGSVKIKQEMGDGGSVPKVFSHTPGKHLNGIALTQLIHSLSQIRAVI